MTNKLTQTGSQASQELSRSLCQQIIIDGIDVNGCELHYKNYYNNDCCKDGYDRPCQPKEWQCCFYVE